MEYVDWEPWGLGHGAQQMRWGHYRDQRSPTYNHCLLEGVRCPRFLVRQESKNNIGSSYFCGVKISLPQR